MKIKLSTALFIVLSISSLISRVEGGGGDDPAPPVVRVERGPDVRPPQHRDVPPVDIDEQPAQPISPTAYAGILSVAVQMKTLWNETGSRNPRDYAGVTSEAFHSLRTTYNQADMRAQHVMNGFGWLLATYMMPSLPLPLPKFIRKLLKTMGMVVCLDFFCTELSNSLLEDDEPRRISATTYLLRRNAQPAG